MWSRPAKVEGQAMSSAAAPAVAAPSSTARVSTRRSIETLVVVLAFITIVGVLAGILARICGGRHLAGSDDRDIEGWVERRCRSCLDSGIPAPKAASGGGEEEKK